METIADFLKAEKDQVSDKQKNYIKLFKSAGFKVKDSDLVSNIDYPIIKIEKIQLFLRNLLIESLKKRYTFSYFLKRRIKNIHQSVEVNGKGFSLQAPEDAWSFSLWAEWTETPISEFKGTPPEHILKSIVQAKRAKIFDRIEIVTCSSRVYKDPLVVGIKEGINDRWLIDYWENDIDVSRLI